MKRTVLCFLIIPTLTAASAAQHSPNTHRVQGVVLDSQTDAPLAGARVFLWQQRAPAGPGGQVEIRTCSGLCVFPAKPGTLAITDRAGHFEFDNLEAASFSLSAERNGYEGHSSESIRAGSPEALTNFVIKLTSKRTVTGAVGGRIRDSLTGRPVAGISVVLVRRGYNSAGQQTLEEAEATLTNDLGEYRIYWVEPGRCYVAADGMNRPSTSMPTRFTSRTVSCCIPGLRI